MNESVMQVAQFAGAQQQKQDAYADSFKTQQQNTSPAGNPAPDSLQHQEVQAHGMLPRMPGATSSFALNQAPKAPVLGQAAKAF